MPSPHSRYPSPLWAILGVLFSISDTAQGATMFRHKWDTVRDLMGMHGQGGTAVRASIDFAAEHYGMITTAGPCLDISPSTATMEDSTLEIARKLKAANPATLVGMYWRTDFVGEILKCSNFTAELKATGNSSFLRDDNGNLVLEHGHNVMWDYENKEGVALFARALVNVVNQTLSDGSPILDYLFLDGPDWQPIPNITVQRNARLRAAKMEFFANLQNQFDEVRGGRNMFLNGVDEAETAQLFNPTGASGVMIDHWSILQFLLTGNPANVDKCSVKPPQVCGDFNTTAMDALFKLVRSQLLSNMTLQVKGWVGPVISQPGKWPVQMHTPTPGAERQQAMAERFNSELALFLLVAEDYMWWMYSWFWGFDSWVPGQPDSDVPKGFCPQAKCALGAPKGPPSRKAGTWTYSREFAHASVFVDLTNRSASHVTFTGDC
jgi:hypothetical protein